MGAAGPFANETLLSDKRQGCGSRHLPLPHTCAVCGAWVGAHGQPGSVGPVQWPRGHLLGRPQLRQAPTQPPSPRLTFPPWDLDGCTPHPSTAPPPHTHCPTQSEMDWLLGVAFVATGRSEEVAVARKERACLDLGLILGWDPLRETLGRSGGARLQFQCAGESPGHLVQMKLPVGFWAGT